MSTVERKYALIKIQKGDYLLPSNDRSTLWRIYSYEEDGSLEIGNRVVLGTVWAAAKFRGNLESLPEDPTDWEHWEYWCGPFDSRSEAIKDVIR